MGQRLAKSKPTWADVKTKLTSFDRGALLGVLQDLDAADEANRAFLHARFGLGEDSLQPYKKTIERWLWPDVFRGQQTSVSRAKAAIAKYEKALGDPVGVTELLVFYCERAAGFCEDVDQRDAAYLDAIVRVFENALKATANLTGKVHKSFSCPARSRAQDWSSTRLWCRRGHGRSALRVRVITYHRGVPWKRK